MASIIPSSLDCRQRFIFGYTYKSVSTPIVFVLESEDNKGTPSTSSSMVYTRYTEQHIIGSIFLRDNVITRNSRDNSRL